MARVTAQASENAAKARPKPKTPEQKSQSSSTPKSRPKKRTSESDKPKSTTAPDTSVPEFESLPALPGEDEGTVPVYATCADIRRQINAHIRRSGVTQASFCRALSACQGSNADRFRGKGHGGPVQSVQLQKFLRKQGQMAGNTSKVFYTAYIYFEKLRLKAGKEKTDKRLEMENVWQHEGGVDTKKVSENVSLIMHADSKGWDYDQHGAISLRA